MKEHEGTEQKTRKGQQSGLHSQLAACGVLPGLGRLLLLSEANKLRIPAEATGVMPPRLTLKQLGLFARAVGVPQLGTWLRQALEGGHCESPVS